MTENEKKLFLKYNAIDTQNYKKNKELNKKLYFNQIIDNNKKDKRWLILLHGSYACNANCIYCENHKLREKYNNAIITEDIIRQVIYKLGPNIREITWHGGEPLLLPENYFTLINNLKKENNLDFVISLQTNSILLTPEKKFLLDSLQYKIGSSFDGLLNTQNRGKLSTDAILDLIKRHGNDEIGFIAVTTKDSIYNLIDNYKYMKTKNITNIQTAIVRENVIEATNPYLIENEIAVKEVLKYLKFWIYDTENPIYDSYLVRQIKKVLGIITSCEDNDCIGGWLIIDPLGNISMCGMDPMEDNFGNIQDINNYYDILLNPKYLSYILKQKQLVLKECQNCDIFSLCHGGCMGNNYEIDHNFTKINERVCNYNKLLIHGICELILNLDLTNKEIYNPYFLKILEQTNYYSLDEINQIEKEYSNA